jgi:hypothetical protein
MSLHTLIEFCSQRLPPSSLQCGTGFRDFFSAAFRVAFFRGTAFRALFFAIDGSLDYKPKLC